MMAIAHAKHPSGRVPRSAQTDAAGLGGIASRLRAASSSRAARTALAPLGRAATASSGLAVGRTRSRRSRARSETSKGHGWSRSGTRTRMSTAFSCPCREERLRSLRTGPEHFLRREPLLRGPLVCRGALPRTAPHCITTAPPQCQAQVVPIRPHPESRFLDDGSCHGAWTGTMPTWS